MTVIYFDEGTYLNFAILKKLEIKRDSKSSKIFIKRFIKDKMNGISRNHDKWITCIL